MSETVAIKGQFAEVDGMTTLVFADKPYVCVTVAVDGKWVEARLSPEMTLAAAVVLADGHPEWVDRQIASHSAGIRRYVRRVQAARARGAQRLGRVG